MSVSFPSFTHRLTQAEWMDSPDVSEAEIRQALSEIRWVNGYLGGSSTIIREIAKFKDIRRTLEILDLGTGSADIPRALLDWGRQHNMSFQITAIDLNPVAVQEARRLSEDYPELRILRADAFSLPYTAGSFDMVMSSMFLHHFGEAEAVELLKAMARLSRLGFIVNDLERHPAAWLGIRLLGMLTGKGSMFMNDAPLSILKGFSREDLQALTEKAALTGAVIQRRLPFRWVMTWAKTS